MKHSSVFRKVMPNVISEYAKCYEKYGGTQIDCPKDRHTCKLFDICLYLDKLMQWSEVQVKRGSTDTLYKMKCTDKYCDTCRQRFKCWTEKDEE